jgi:hypothetical protein
MVGRFGRTGQGWRARVWAGLVALAAALCAPAARADEGVYAAMCERAVLHGARVGGVPAEVLHAIALTETGRWSGGRLRPWPWAVNREGEGFWFGSRDEALAFAYESVAAGRHSFDMGCFQINYHWHGRGFPSLEAMADPEAGAVYAAQFLRDLYAEFGNWEAAAGAYHSRTPEFAQRYRARFRQLLAGLGAAPLAEPSEAPVALLAPEPKPPVPVRVVRGPKIVSVAQAGVDTRGTGDDDPVAATGEPGVFVVTMDEGVLPLTAGRRL